MSKDYLAISLNEQTLKMAAVRVSPTENRLLNVFRKDIKGVAEEELPKIAAAALHEMGGRKANCIFVLPANVATTKNIEIPSLDPNEIKSIIDLQAGRHTPYSREEILIGYITIGEHQRNYTQVLLIIVNRNVIKKSLGVLDSCGIKVQKVLFAPEGMARFYSKIMHQKKEDGPFGMIDIGRHFTDFVVAFNQTAITCRNIPLGMENLIKEGPEAREKFITELVKSVEAYQTEDVNKTPVTYYLTSDDTKVKELEPILREKFKSNIKLMPYLDQVKADQPIMLKLVSELDDESFLDLVACSVCVDEHQVDLIPEEVKQQRALEDQAKQLVKAGSFAIVLLLLICAVFFSKIYFHGLYLDKLSARFEKEHKEVERLEKISRNTKIVKDFLASRMVSLDVLDELYRNIPDEVYLKSVNMDEEGTITIEGTSETMSLVFNLVSALEGSELFKGVKTKSTTAKKERGKDVAAFEIALRLESAPDIVEEAPEGEGKDAKAKGGKEAAPAEAKKEEKK